MARGLDPTLGERLRHLRRTAGMSLRDVERQHGINSGYLSQLERNEIARPTPAVLEKVARAYGEPLGVVMRWAGYLDDDNTKLTANQRRALKYLGSDPSDEEVAALKAVLDVLRSKPAS